mmetsp:Transcript_26946/g.78210  ORF Transcript_26946/g.78210 Transcript_26946/m.78210 type:complete len:200 (-) Transcript_26946:347-946(-)
MCGPIDAWLPKLSWRTPGLLAPRRSWTGRSRSECCPRCLHGLRTASSSWVPFSRPPSLDKWTTTVCRTSLAYSTSLTATAMADLISLSFCVVLSALSAKAGWNASLCRNYLISWTSTTLRRWTTQNFALPACCSSFGARRKRSALRLSFSTPAAMAASQSPRWPSGCAACAAVGASPLATRSSHKALRSARTESSPCTM